MKDTEQHYGGVSRFNHWIGALVVIAMLAVGLYFGGLPRGDEKSFLRGMHVSFGGLLFLFLIFRVMWRVFSKSPDPVEQAKPLKIVTKLVHWILLLCVLIMAVSGPWIVWSAGYGINVFDLFTIPTPIERMQELHKTLEVVHEYTAQVLLYTLILHVLAVLKHQFIDKDNLLSRMVKRLR